MTNVMVTLPTYHPGVQTWFQQIETIFVVLRVKIPENQGRQLDAEVTTRRHEQDSKRLHGTPGAEPVRPLQRNDT